MVIYVYNSFMDMLVVIQCRRNIFSITKLFIFFALFASSLNVLFQVLSLKIPSFIWFLSILISMISYRHTTEKLKSFA